jgi:hypothetical protein
MDENALLNTLLTAASILVAIGFPFIIFLVSDYRNIKNKLLGEIKSLYPKLEAFNALIGAVDNFGIVKNFENELRKAKTPLEKNEVLESASYPLYKAFRYFAKLNTQKAMFEYDDSIYSFQEIEKYNTYANSIWYCIDCRNDVKRELKIERFEELTEFEIEQFYKDISKIKREYSQREIGLGLISSVAGDLEVEILRPLAWKTFQYEKPIPKIVKRLFLVLTFSLIFGVLIPLILMLNPNWQCLCLISMLFGIVIVCFTLIVVFTREFINGEVDN